MRGVDTTGYLATPRVRFRVGLLTAPVTSPTSGPLHRDRTQFHAQGKWREPHGGVRGNVSTPFEDGLPRLLRIGQDLGVHVDHHLVALPRGAGIQPLMEGRPREWGHGVGLLVGDRGRFRGAVPAPAIYTSPP